MNRSTGVRRGRLGDMSTCPVFQCGRKMRSWCFMCVRCWKTLDSGLQGRIMNERHNAKLAGTRHTDALLSARDDALAFLNAHFQTIARKKSKPPPGREATPF